MTDETPRPIHRRRRWFLIGVLLLTAAVAGRWCWPRTDPRFVGRWTWSIGRMTNPLPVYEFRSSGDGTASHPAWTGENVLSWHVDGNRFILVRKRLSGFSQILGRIQMALLVWRSDLLKFADVEEYEIAEMSADLIRLKAESANRQKREIVLRRTAE